MPAAQACYSYYSNFLQFIFSAQDNYSYYSYFFQFILLGASQLYLMIIRYEMQRTLKASPLNSRSVRRTCG